MSGSNERPVVQNTNGAPARVTDSTLAAFIWRNAEDLWGDFKHSDFGKIILPFTLLRRLECVLEPTRDKIREVHTKVKDKKMDVALILRQTAGRPSTTPPNIRWRP